MLCESLLFNIRDDSCCWGADWFANLLVYAYWNTGKLVLVRRQIERYRRQCRPGARRHEAEHQHRSDERDERSYAQCDAEPVQEPEDENTYEPIPPEKLKAL